MPVLPFRSVLPILTHLCAALLACVCLTATAAAAPVKFDIPAQSAADALIAFSKQSGHDVLYSFTDLQAVRSHAVVGDYEPDDALGLLLTDTGFAATRNGGKFVVARARVVPGSVRGSLTLPSGDAAAGVTVTVWETSQSVRTDRDGEFFFSGIAPGTYRLVTRADGFQPLHITDVAVKENREITLSRLTLRAADEVTKLKPVTVQAESVEKLDPYSVEGRREKPFTAGNMDLPRTVDDVQPYYVFTGRELSNSGAISVDDFLRRHLTMNLQAFTNTQAPNGAIEGNDSLVNLRGLGTSRTLILVNGRQMVGSATLGGSTQTDINNISMGEIERIEVLPTSASGIYGGSALGGVINVILKKDYTGAEIDARYETPWDTDAPHWSAALRYGGGFAGGRGRYKFSVSQSGGSSLYLQDRIELWQEYFDRTVANSPGFIYTSGYPWLGSLPNIITSSATLASLTLDNGVSIGSRTTHVPAGTSATTPLATVYAGLLANAGTWNLAPPPIAILPSGLLQRIYAAPHTRAFTSGLTWNESPNLEFYADFSYRENQSSGDLSPISSTFTVAANSPVNPFTTAVRMDVPIDSRRPSFKRTITRSVVAGLVAHLPADWKGNFDFVHGDSDVRQRNVLSDTTALAAAVNAGTLNPFVDTLSFPLNIDPYLIDSQNGSVLTSESITLRAAGPLPSLLGGAPHLSTNVGYRVERTHDGWAQRTYLSTPRSSYDRTYFPGRQALASASSELLLPLVAPRRFPFVDTLVAQLTGRVERASVDTGTTYESYAPATGATTYGGTTVGGKPYFISTVYESANYVLGLKYQPVAEIILRGSVSTAFQAPTAANLLDNPTPGNASISDPKTKLAYTVQTDSGGNPNLKPENSSSRDLGIVWEPKRWKLDGLRVSVQWQKTSINDRATSMTAQNLINAEAFFPERVLRDASGLVTFIDTTIMNLFREDVESWDFSIDYDRRTSLGTFGVHVSETYTPHRIRQYAFNTPGYEGSGYDAMEAGGGPKVHSQLRLDWRRSAWEAGWSVTYWGRTKVYAAKGGPASMQSYGGAANPTYALAQGDDEVAGALYHDAYLGYTFARRPPAASGSRWRDHLATRLLSDTTLQFGVNNVFNRYPPFNAGNFTLAYFSSYYGDLRLRTFWLQLRKGF